jgi:hypothetical protein
MHIKIIQVNYAPNGFTAYEIPGKMLQLLGGTGMPVAIQCNTSIPRSCYSY